jgi:hypothetical protein
VGRVETTMVGVVTSTVAMTLPAWMARFMAKPEPSAKPEMSDAMPAPSRAAARGRMSLPAKVAAMTTTVEPEARAACAMTWA